MPGAVYGKTPQLQAQLIQGGIDPPTHPDARKPIGFNLDRGRIDRIDFYQRHPPLYEQQNANYCKTKSGTKI
jgi:hypothetical protein